VIGPVQVLVVGFDQPRFSGEVLAEFTRLREAGIVRLIDLLLVSRTEGGALETMTAPEGFAADLGGVAAEILGRPAVAGDTEPEPTEIEAVSDAAKIESAATWSLADAIPILPPLHSSSTCGPLP